MPFDAKGAYATLSPYSSTFGGTPWTGLRFFLAHVSKANFRRALEDINVYCLAHSAQR